MKFTTTLGSALSLASLAAANKIGFADYTRQVPCGINGVTCGEPFCVASIKDVYGCNGQSQQLAGVCRGLTGSSTTTLDLCGKAHAYINGCHLKVGKPPCIDFRNEVGDFGRWVCTQGIKSDGDGCGDFQAGQTCADMGLGDCP